jgi:TP901 family phage tail tape measure protein
MPLGVREVLLVVRAQNSATSVLTGLATSFRKLNQAQQEAANAAINQGKSLVAVGVGIAAVGAAGLDFMKHNTAAASAYNKQVAYTKTQMQGVKATLNQVSNAGLQVAKSVPVAFDDIQGGLYDIFSSMNVNMKQAKVLLTSFSKASVAGQVSLQDADRATIGIMNAYHLKATQVNKVNDEMFQLVAKGVGTYADFANSIGRAVPSAARAGENFKQLAGMMAFLTRNGLSASNAASSAGRALDALVKTSPLQFEQFGKTIVSTLGLTGDAAKKYANAQLDIVSKAGNLKNVTTIIKDMSSAMKGLTNLQRSEVLTQIFKGTGGTIQAMRFLSPATSTGGSKELSQLTEDMKKSGGTMEKAFQIMQNTPAEKIAQLKNDFQALQVELGQGLLPVLGFIAASVGRVVKFFADMSPHTLKLIGIIVTVTSALVFLTGVVIALTGAFIILGTIFAGVELLGAPILVTVGLIVAAVIALAVAAFFIIKYWGPITTWFHNLWFDIWHWIDNVMNNIKRDVNSAWSTIINDLVKFGHNVEHMWHDIWQVIITAFKIYLTILLLPWVALWLLFRVPLTLFWNWVRPYMKNVFNWIRDGWDALTQAMTTGWRNFWGWVTSFLKTSWTFIKTIFRNSSNSVQNAWSAFWGGLKSAAKATWGWIVNGWDTQFWNPIKQSFRRGIQIVGSIWNGIKGPLAGPVNWVIRYIYDDGIAKVWNTAAGIVGAPKLPNIQPLKFAKGGIVNKPTLGVFGEAGPEMILPLNNPKRMMELLGKVMPMHASGGIFGSIGSAIHHIGGWISSGVADLGKKALGPVEALLNKIPGAKVEKTLLMDAGHKLITDAIRKLTGESNKFGGGAGRYKGKISGGVAQWRPQVLQALKMLGEPSSLANNVLYQMMTESGGNPNAINLTDSNAAAGDPSRGLMQTIMSTFEAYAGPFRSRSIYNPLANIYAAINYAIHRYGRSLMSNGMGIGSGHGYAAGGTIPAGAIGLVGERGPELVEAGRGGAKVTSHAKTKVKLSSEASTALTLINQFVSGLVDTLSKIKTEQKDAIKEIEKYYTGSHAKWREQQIDRQSKSLESMVNSLSKVQAQIAAAKNYRSNLRSSLSGYADLSTITAGTTATLGPNGSITTTSSIPGQLQAKLKTLRQFATALKALKKAGLDNSMIRQIVAMGPDDGLAYAQAILQGGGGLISTLNATEKAINNTEGQLATTATNILYDSGKQAGKGFLSGLKAQRKELDKEMARLGDTIGKELAKWFHVPKGRLPHFASGGFLPAGQWGIVGEYGPEMIMGGSSGTRVTPGGRRGATQNFYIYTQEINPRKHAAELGWELARRSG